MPLFTDSSPTVTKVTDPLIEGFIIMQALSGIVVANGNNPCSVMGGVSGSILYNDPATGWAPLAPGVAGQFLTTQGVGVAPNWTSVQGTPINIAAANYNMALSDVGKPIILKAAAAAGRTVNLPAGPANGFATGNVINANSSFSLTIQAPAGVALDGILAGSFVLPPGMIVSFYYDNADGWHTVQLNYNQSVASTGYYKFQNGIIFQWGNNIAINSSGTSSWTYPVTFPNNVFIVIGTVAAPNQTTYWMYQTVQPQTTLGAQNQLFIKNGANTFQAGNAHLFAIGN